MGTGTEANGGRGGDGIGNTGTLATGIDDDVVIGTGGSGGSATGFGGDGGHGILNKGIIDMGDGNDVVTGIGGAGGTGPLFSGNRGAGIYNTGTILMGKGADSLTGSGLKAIFNGDRGRIDTGSGNDTVDALAGGFSGVGLIALGGDRDTLKGFGMGRFDGGSGTDTLLIGAPGTYTISTLGRDLTGYYTISNGQIGMYVQNFELIGNATTAQTFTFAAAQQLIVQA